MTETISYVEASRRALTAEMRSNPKVWALGEDIGRGGVFTQYKGLQEIFGPDRIVDTPISESCIAGAAIGAAMLGTRPVVEMRFSDFALCAADELINQAAKARYMFGGQTKVPLVVRQPIGLWRSSAAQHSQSLEAWYAHIPGLVVITPSTPQDNYTLLRAAIRSDDPVIYMEHKGLWPAEGPVDEAVAIDPVAEIGKGAIRREGSDVTLVSWAAAVIDALAAAEALAADGISVEVIDLRTLYPWDRDLVLSSVAKTGRLVVVHEAVQTGGFGGEIAATVAEELHAQLKAPVKRIGASRVPTPYSRPLEDEVRVTLERDIVPAVRRLVGAVAA